MGARVLPERSMDYLTLKPEEFLYGLFCVYNHMLTVGMDASGYMKHLLFISRHVMEHNFHVSACLRYDRYVVDNVINGRAKFGDIDPIAVRRVISPWWSNPSIKGLFLP